MNIEKWETKNILEICTIERAKKGKEYECGCTLVQISATRGRVVYLEKSGKVNAEYAVFIPKVDINRFYLFIVIDREMIEFLAKYQTGLNIQIDILSRLDIKLHVEKETQNEMARLFLENRKFTEQTEAEIKALKDLKKYFLNEMLC